MEEWIAIAACKPKRTAIYFMSIEKILNLHFVIINNCQILCKFDLVFKWPLMLLTAFSFCIICIFIAVFSAIITAYVIFFCKITQRKVHNHTLCYAIAYMHCRTNRHTIGRAVSYIYCNVFKQMFTYLY